MGNRSRRCLPDRGTLEDFIDLAIRFHPVRRPSRGGHCGRGGPVPLQRPFRLGWPTGALGAEHLVAGPCGGLGRAARRRARESQEGGRGLFSQIADRLGINPDATDFYGELDQFDLREITDRLISAGSSTSFRPSGDGGYLRYAPASVIARFFIRHPDNWFGTVWTDRLPDPDRWTRGRPTNWREQVVGVFGRCLEDCAAYVRFGTDDPLILARAGRPWSIWKPDSRDPLPWRCRDSTAHGKHSSAW